MSCRKGMMTFLILMCSILFFSGMNCEECATDSDCGMGEYCADGKCISHSCQEVIGEHRLIYDGRGYLDNCVSSTQLMDYYCESPTGEPLSREIVCSNGCASGGSAGDYCAQCGDVRCEGLENYVNCASDCIEPGNLPISCTESDGGLDYYIWGSCDIEYSDGTTQAYLEQCSSTSPSVLRECYCADTYGPILSLEYTCLNGCLNGACVLACGDGSCEGPENILNCPQDCHLCGDGICSSTSGEDVNNCIDDCGNAGTIIIGLDAYEFEPTAGSAMSSVEIKENIYALAYEGKSGPNKIGNVRTVGINAVGSMSTIDTYSFETASNISNPVIFNVAEDTFGVIYDDNKSGLVVRMFNITDNGAIQKDSTIKLVVDSTGTYPPSILKRAPNTFIVIYGSASRGFFKTVNLNLTSRYVIASYTIDSTTSIPASSLLQIPYSAHNDLSGSIYINRKNETWVRSWGTPENGNFGCCPGAGQLKIGSADSTLSFRPRIEHIYGDVYLTATIVPTSSLGGRTIVLKTVRIDQYGFVWDLTSTAARSTTDLVLSDELDMVNITKGVFAISYNDDLTGAGIITVRVNNSGSIEEKTIDNKSLNSDFGNPELFRTGKSTYGLAYDGTDTSGDQHPDGWLKIYRIVSQDIFGIPPFCGDRICQSSNGETGINCASDCMAVCGNLFCESAESIASCPQDCE